MTGAVCRQPALSPPRRPEALAHGGRTVSLTNEALVGRGMVSPDAHVRRYFSRAFTVTVPSRSADG